MGAGIFTSSRFPATVASRTSHAREVFERSLERVRTDYGFAIDAYVVMPEHVHLLVSEPKLATVSVAMQALKISVVRRLTPRPFWQARFYDFNVFTDEKRIEKRRYIHRNPFARASFSILRTGSGRAIATGHMVSAGS